MAVFATASPRSLRKITCAGVVLTVFYLYFAGRSSSDFTLAPVSSDQGPAHENENNPSYPIDPALSSNSAYPTTPTATTLPTTKSHPATSEVDNYVNAIMNPADMSLPRLDCPALNSNRYAYLKDSHSNTNTIIHDDQLTYLFALNLRGVETLLPRLLGSVVEVIRFLGPSRCMVSIVEGNSDDRTLEILEALEPAFQHAGIAYKLQRSSVNPAVGERITKLAELRNLPLDPLMTFHSNDSGFALDDTTVVFLNDVAACPEDILELVHQHRTLGADMVCAMDWTYVFEYPTFYDIWIARTITGDIFFDIPSNGTWDYAKNLFWNDADTNARFLAHQPFQVFSCWNGAVVFHARSVVGDDAIRFRAPKDDECFQGEPELFCKDMWYRGMHKIAVVPSVSLEYSNDAARKLKAMKGFTSQWTDYEDAEANQISWTDQPPKEVRCLPADYSRQHWRPWDESLG